MNCLKHGGPVKAYLKEQGIDVVEYYETPKPVVLGKVGILKRLKCFFAR
jgi:hypothetical protein